MIPLELDVVEPLGRLVARPWADAVTGLQIDSRRIREGDLFVAVGGGADFVEHALARGAGAALVPEDAHAALAAVAGAVRSRSRARVVGITGSTGKTSTKDILYAMCAPHRRTIANEANYNNELGVPLTLARLEEDTEICITEMGMRGLGQIAYLASFARPDVAVITNVGPVHLELVGTIENVARAKAELVEALPPGGVAVVPEEPLLEPYLTRDDIVVRRVDPARPLPFPTGYSARHQLVNTRAAVAVAESLGVPLPDGELHVEFSKLREEEHALPGGGLLLNDCYNANPVSMRAALEHLTERARGRRVAVLGEMAELGEEGLRYHREIGALVRELGIEQVIAVGELARAYGGDWVATAAEAATRAEAVLAPGDTVLVKGSRAVGLEVVAENLTA
ncbi:MAG TPA: UDP-N-acetylmuramoyl-tripeptide--D-alanyl-D-alanine ligase [Gaiellaceae bacterium]|nr:UDP-N-acetylmuramoyl-tripeptide--D-alanyl-D-alanine ligase [Gaiellaceae bacterium]